MAAVLGGKIQRRRCCRDSLRGAARRAGDARDAGRYQRDRRRGAIGQRGAPHRWPIQRSYARFLCRPCRSGSRGGRTDCRRRRRRHHPHRYPKANHQSGSFGNHDPGAPQKHGKRPSRVTARASSPNTSRWLDLLPKGRLRRRSDLTGRNQQPEECLCYCAEEALA